MVQDLITIEMEVLRDSRMGPIILGLEDPPHFGFGAKSSQSFLILTI